MPAPREIRDLHGWVILDKPAGMTSTQALRRVVRLCKARKGGHGGTLDPLATGVIPLAFGEATKTLAYVLNGDKTYHFTVQWGSETDTDDLEGKIVATSNLYDYIIQNNELKISEWHVAAQHQLRQNLLQFHGAVQQKPPAFSAIRLGGARAYDLARQGARLDLQARTVSIHALKIVGWPTPHCTTFEVHCSKGTYVRAIARDLGRATGWLGHVTMLRRIRVGPFAEADAISLEKLEEVVHRQPSENSLAGILRPIETVLDGIPALAVMEQDARRLQHGQRVPLADVGGLLPAGKTRREAEAVLVTSAGKPIGLFRIEQGVLKTIRLFNL